MLGGTNQRVPTSSCSANGGPPRRGSCDGLYMDGAQFIQHHFSEDRIKNRRIEEAQFFEKRLAPVETTLRPLIHRKVCTNTMNIKIYIFWVVLKASFFFGMRQTLYFDLSKMLQCWIAVVDAVNLLNNL